MDKPKYNIGDVVYVGKWEAREFTEPCPDCGGTRKLKVILFDGTEYDIACEGCKRGYDGPYGFVRRTAYKASVSELVIQGVEMGCFSDEKGQWKYRLGYEIGSNICSYQSVKESEIFLDEQAAMQFALAKGRQMEINEASRVMMKEKPTHTWAWHVTYHRREIKRAKRDLEYHSQKLGIAKEKSKEKI